MAQSKKPFLSFIIAAELLAAIDDYRFTHRFESRAATITWLIKKSLGLTA
jgi:hypothetical protein